VRKFREGERVQRDNWGKKIALKKIPTGIIIVIMTGKVFSSRYY
jgi:hypothetical protein